MIKDSNCRLSVTVSKNTMDYISSIPRSKTKTINLAIWILQQLENGNIDIDYDAAGKPKKLVIGCGDDAYYRTL